MAAARAKKTAMVKPSMDKLYGEAYTTYTAKYGPNTAILLNVGSFYSMYDKIHVETGVSLRNLQEVAHICHGSPRIESREGEWNHVMWGFPESSYARFEQALIQNGFTVVFIGQDRDATAKVTGRSLERVTSPGTYMDSGATGSAIAEDRHVVGVLVEAFLDPATKRIAWYMASTAFTVSTGDCTSIEQVVNIVDGRPNLDALESFWSTHAPSEVVVWTRDLTLQESQIRVWFAGAFRGPIHIHEAPKASAMATRGALQYLHRLYAKDTALRVGTYLDVENYQAAMESLAFLLHWIEDHNPSYLVNLRDHRMWESAEELVLGNAALQQLGMLPLFKPNECLLHWLQKTQTPMGRRALRERCVRPITDCAELEARQERIAEARTLTGVLKPHLYTMADLAKLYRSFHMGTGTREALVGMLGTAKKALHLADLCTQTSFPMPAEAKTFAEDLLGTWDLDRISACTTEHKYGLGPHHPWRLGIHADLDTMERTWGAIWSEVETVHRSWCRLIEESEDAIKITWDAEDGEFLWTTTKRRAVALTTLLKTRKQIQVETHTKGSGASTTVTLSSPQLTDLSQRANTCWRTWSSRVEECWKESWAPWANGETGGEGSRALLDWIAQVDVDVALARCAEEYGYVRPTYVRNDYAAGFSVTDLRHPILERVHTDTPYIPHSLAMGALASNQGPQGATAEHGILLYGVNAAGKSSLSKAVGLAVLMAQIGMPVPATAMSIAPYNGLYTRILGNDNLWAGMSSFVVEMTELRTILNAGPRALVLGDELCAGTETTSAIAIVGAGIKRLVQKGANFIFATHLHELLEIPELAAIPTVRPYYLSVQAEGHKLIYDRILREGRGPAIYGLEVCRGLDMDPVFLEMAATLRREWEGGGVEFAKVSRYNAAVPVQACHVCGARDGLETHHIVPQAAADAAGFVAQGRHKNEAGNLAVLCNRCHDQHHAGEIEVRGWKATSTGRKLDLMRFARRG